MYFIYLELNVVSILRKSYLVLSFLWFIFYVLIFFYTEVCIQQLKN